MKIAYFDCFSGISGNMILGALLDAGLEAERLKAELDRLQISGYELKIERVKRKDLQGTWVEVEVEDTHHHRHLPDIERIIQGSDLPSMVKQRSLATFHRLAEAEAHVHGIPVESVHFHEVGALDAIVDVVGACVGLWLMGIDQVFSSPVRIGCGTVECAHGTMPVPAPATQVLLKSVPVYGRDVNAELATPTGAAILTTIVESFGPPPPMVVESIGYGAGSRELPHSNMLRISIGSTSPEVNQVVGQPGDYERDVVTLIEANIDDMNPQWYDHVMQRLFDAGALDVFLTTIQMKHNRPGVQLSVMAPQALVTELVEIVFAETTTIGLRISEISRLKLARETMELDTVYGTIGAKVTRRGGKVVNITPEYQDCRTIAREQGIPLKEVYRASQQMGRDQIEDQ